MLPYSLLVDPNENPPYIWVTVEQADVVLGRMKLEITGDLVIIRFLTVDFHWRKKGVATFAVDYLKERYFHILAPDVRADAVGFWEVQKFSRIPLSNDWEWHQPCPR
ncbi:hypothetical protein KKF84_10635 [Myxococcota bacterium]|nr:hypothetical protein [Myxococcota bacterium]MBU1535767.1 hypothetical protein [Myxococcota bacterium]